MEAGGIPQMVGILIEERELIKAVIWCGKNPYKVMETPPGTKLRRRSSTIKEEIWFIDQLLGPPENSIEIFIGSPLIFIKEEIFW